MKIAKTIALASAGILAAGCAHEEHNAQYNQSTAPYSNQSSQYNASSPNGPAAATASESDDALVSQVHQALQQDPQIAPVVPNIQITADHGMVVLSGTVQSGEQKRRIQSIAAGVFGVDILDDHLRVSGAPMSPTSNDTNSLPRIYHDAGSGTNDP